MRVKTANAAGTHHSPTSAQKQYLHPVADLKLWSPGYYLSQSWNVHYVFPALFAWFLRFWGYALVFVWVCFLFCFFKYPLSKKQMRSQAQGKKPKWIIGVVASPPFCTCCCRFASFPSLPLLFEPWFHVKAVQLLSPTSKPENQHVLPSEAYALPELICIIWIGETGNIYVFAKRGARIWEGNPSKMQQEKSRTLPRDQVHPTPGLAAAGWRKNTSYFNDLH